MIATVSLQREAGATPQNLAALRSVLIGASTYSALVTGSASDGSTAEAIFSERPPGTAAGQKYVFGIRLAGETIGCLDAIRGWPQAATCHIGLLLLDERYQRRGYGREAMRLLCDQIVRWGDINTLRIGVVASNTPAFPFWRAMGFADTGERKSHPAFTSDVVIMTVPLRDATTATHHPGSGPARSSSLR